MMINRFVKTGDSYEPIEHTLYVWVRKIRPAPIVTAAKYPHERQRILNVVKIWKPEIFPRGAKVERAKWISPNSFRTYLRKGVVKMKPHNKPSLSAKNMAVLYRKIGVICEKPKQIGI